MITLLKQIFSLKKKNTGKMRNKEYREPKQEINWDIYGSQGCEKVKRKQLYNRSHRTTLISFCSLQASFEEAGGRCTALSVDLLPVEQQPTFSSVNADTGKFIL